MEGRIEETSDCGFLVQRGGFRSVVGVHFEASRQVSGEGQGQHGVRLFQRPREYHSKWDRRFQVNWEAGEASLLEYEHDGR